MFRFRIEFFLPTLAAILLVGAFGMLWPVIAESHQYLVRIDAGADLLCYLVTAVLVCVGGGVRRRLPNYAGAPPLRDVVRILLPFAFVVLFAGANIAWASALIEGLTALQSGRSFALQMARGISLGVILCCLYHAALILVVYRRDIAWERRMHPNEHK